MLGIGISDNIAMLNPGKIVTAGKGIQAERILFDPMHESIEQYISKKIGNDRTKIITND